MAIDPKSDRRSVVRMTADLARRITGVSTPFGGVQWADPGPSQREIIRRFIVALEDRRVLYNPSWLEDRNQVDSSIHQIRNTCTDTLQHLGEADFGAVSIRAVRSACRRYHDDANLDFRFVHLYERKEDITAGFLLALGQFRSSVGYQVAVLAAHYDLDVEGDLARILPDLDGE